MANMAQAIRMALHYAETNYELKDVFGMGVTIVTTAKNKDEATDFFSLIGVPFK